MLAELWENEFWFKNLKTVAAPPGRLSNGSGFIKSVVGRIALAIFTKSEFFPANASEFLDIIKREQENTIRNF
jgi:hypothetical protein|tara:strand:- start:100 stop:318 length:219 start_codon:yes stop_codon:yes gene_type:complete